MRVIEKYKVYGGRYFRNFVYMALDDAYSDDDFITFINLKTGEKEYDYAHQCVLIENEDYVNEYLFTRLPDDFYDNEVPIEDTEFGPFLKLVEEINDKSTLKDVNDIHDEIDQRFFDWFDMETKSRLLNTSDRFRLKSFSFLIDLRRQHKHAIFTIYSKKGAIIL